MKSNDFLNEDLSMDANSAQLDHEIQLARQELYHSAEDALTLHRMLRDIPETVGLEGWVAAKITLAADYLNTVREYLEYQLTTGDARPENADVVIVGETAGVTDYNPKSHGGTRKELLAKYHKTKNPKDAEAARRAGATEKELQVVAEGVDTGEYDARKTQPSSKQQQDKVFAKHKERVKALSTDNDTKKQGVAEGYEDNPVVNAITRRILMQRTDLLSKYGPGYVAQAIDDVADGVGEWEEIGTSDVSGWVRQVEWNLKNKLNQYDEPMDVGDALDESSNSVGLSEMSAGSVATVVNPPAKNKAKVGTLFGGTYQQKKVSKGKK